MPSTSLRPDFTGTWQAKLERSVLRSASPGQIVQKIAHAEPGLEQETILTREGREQRLLFRYLTTGEETLNQLAGRTVRNRAHWDGDCLVIESWTDMAGRELHFEDRWTLSEDGNSLTMAHRDDPLAGQVVVHDRITET